MIDILAEEISMGKKQLSGPKIIFWIALIKLAIGPIISIISFSTGFFSMFAPGGKR